MCPRLVYAHNQVNYLTVVLVVWCLLMLCGTVARPNECEHIDITDRIDDLSPFFSAVSADEDLLTYGRDKTDANAT